MYPSAFEYSAPDSLGEALALLAELGADARILAGGQSLIPMMKLRLGDRRSTWSTSTASPSSDTSGARTATSRSARWPGTPTSPRPPTVRARPRGRARRGPDRRPAGAQPRHRLRLGRALRPRGRLELGDARHRRDASWPTSASGERIVPPTSSSSTSSPTRCARARWSPRSGSRSPTGARGGGAYLKLERKIGDYATVGVATHLRLDDGGHGSPGPGSALTARRSARTSR